MRSLKISIQKVKRLEIVQLRDDGTTLDCRKDVAFHVDASDNESCLKDRLIEFLKRAGVDLNSELQHIAEANDNN